MATNGNDIYFRLPHDKSEIFVNLGIGEVCSELPPGILGYTAHWEFVLDDGMVFETIVKSIEISNKPQMS
ncbi:hypothetical protein CPter291_1108 [Collimonas pratensis]|uniref:Uncharacterized protein n=1 Tax=Collimonas pratensis TaxID=279113 RepID=A0ABM5Z334_9BURK|nr:hypothetical protein CPter291_1108 [Collimonas pratensis]